MNGCILLLATALSATSVTAPGDPRKSFQLTPQGWQRIEPAPATDPPDPATVANSDPQLTRVSDLLKRSAFAAASDQALDWLKSNPGSPAYDRGLYLMAEALRGQRQYIRAFYYCDQLLDEHPDSSIYSNALQLQYEIADAYLKGAKDRLIGLRIIGRQDEAVEMLFRIQQRAPGSTVAENALLRTADFYAATGDFDLAADAYHAYADTYPRSPLAARARLKEAEANDLQFNGVNFDTTSQLNARTIYRRVAAETPELAQEANVDARLRDIDRRLARSSSRTQTSIAARASPSRPPSSAIAQSRGIRNCPKPTMRGRCSRASTRRTASPRPSPSSPRR